MQSWKEEAQSVINDIKQHVLEAQISECLESSDQKIHLNLATLENNKYCIELSASGFRVVGNDFNESNLSEGSYFETPYSLLSSLSPQFHNSFGSALLMKLSALQENSGK